MSTTRNLHTEAPGIVPNQILETMQTATEQIQLGAKLLRDCLLTLEGLAQTTEPRTSEDPSEDRVITAVIRGTAEQMTQVAAITGRQPEQAELTDDNGYAWYSAGPLILENIIRMTHGVPVTWSSLTAEEQAAVVRTAAESFQWTQGDLDPYRVDNPLEEYPSLYKRLHPGPQGQAG